MKNQIQADNNGSTYLGQQLCVGRPKKASPQATIEYEMKMLQFARVQIISAVQEGRASAPHFWEKIECFLLHYRNLIQFLGGSEKRKDDLSFTADFGDQIDETLIIAIEKVVKPLVEKYSNQISKYLAHCTRLRHELDRDWYINEMYFELLPAIHLLRSAFGLQAWNQQGDMVLKWGESLLDTSLM